MADVNEIVGSDAPDTIGGTPADDLIYGYDPAGSTAAISSISVEHIATALSQPVAAIAAPDDLDHLFIVERTGSIVVLDLRDGTTSAFLDIAASITTAGEGGLLDHGGPHHR